MQEIEQVPLFMTKAPEDGAEVSDALAALQALQFEDSTPDGVYYCVPLSMWADLLVCPSDLVILSSSDQRVCQLLQLHLGGALKGRWYRSSFSRLEIQIKCIALVSASYSALSVL